ncbi:MAG: nucleotidyl transferase [Bdellovibrio sp.]|nr:MAG: nucleotidyl transferase [Bdellovibrio sp.]
MNVIKFNQMPIVILAGGLATRLKPISEAIPKSLMDINGQPFLKHQISLLQKEGLRKVYLCVGHLSEKIKEFLDFSPPKDIEIKIIDDGKPLKGTGGALKEASKQIKEDCFFVTYGDSYLPINFKKVFEYYISQNQPALMTIYKNQNAFDKSNVIFKNGQIKDYDKNKTSPDMQYIDYGLMIFQKSLFKSISHSYPFDLSLILSDLVKNNLVAAYEVFERFYEIGTPKGIQSLKNYLYRKEREVLNNKTLKEAREERGH